MLSKADNETLCRVGPGTPMGAVFRRFWHPVCLSEQVAKPDGDPVRVEILGERLVAFRDTSGKLGLLEEGCPHRGVSLALGRNEDAGLRCLYHGWKFAVDGTILDMPNCPDLRLARNVKAKTYPIREAGGFLWAYLGPSGKMPAFPTWRFLDIPVEHMRVNRIDADVNYMQQLEGGADTSHVGILHSNFARPGWMTGAFNANTDQDNPAALATGDLAPTLAVEDTPFGFHYAAIRQVDGNEADGKRNVRVVPIIMPSTRIIPSPAVQFIIFEVPMNDTRTATFAASYRLDGAPVDQWKLNEMSGRHNPQLFDEKTHRYIGTWENRFGQDRARMSEDWSGIKGVVMEDMAMAMSQGAIADRSKEHLVPADQAVVRCRRQLLESARRVADGGDPIGVEVDVSTIRAIDATVPGNVRWQDLVTA
ncbi:MAG: Rieske 2Fe-2S domain-containing protein [Enhydrobacter sp.]|nr:Rieske 2Fe-2S domain-containing protein [Enhydrobacter sp.]